MSNQKSSEPPTLGAGQLAFLVAQVGALAAMRFAERVATLGLTPALAGLVRAVGEQPGRSQQAVATQLGVLPSRLVVLVDELERDGLLERRREPQDRRHYALHLTSDGEVRLGQLARLARSHGEDFLAPLDTHDRIVLARLLAQLSKHHGLTPRVHPGYRTLGSTNADVNPR